MITIGRIIVDNRFKDSNTCARTCIHTHTHARARTHIHAHAHIHTHARTNTHIHVKTHTHARTHTHTHTHTRGMLKGSNPKVVTVDDLTRSNYHLFLRVSEHLESLRTWSKNGRIFVQSMDLKIEIQTQKARKRSWSSTVTNVKLENLYVQKIRNKNDCHCSKTRSRHIKVQNNAIYKDKNTTCEFSG